MSTKTAKPPKKQYTEEENIALSKTKNTKTPEELATEHMPFVYHLVDKEFSRYYKHVGISRDVLVSAGMMGLVKAANRSKYGTFIRYASFWIRYYIYSEIRGHFFIKRQSSYCAKLNKIRREQAKYINKHGKEPSYYELAKLVGMPYETIKDVIEFDENNETSTISLDALNDNPNSNAGDAVMAQEISEEGYDVINTSSIDFPYLRSLIDETLDGVEKEIIIKHYFEHKEVKELVSEYRNKLNGLKIQDVIEAAICRVKEHVALDKKWLQVKRENRQFT